MISRKMRHIVYRSDGVPKAALGVVKKIDLTAPETGRWLLVTEEGDLMPVISSRRRAPDT